MTSFDLSFSFWSSKHSSLKLRNGVHTSRFHQRQKDPALKRRAQRRTLARGLFDGILGTFKSEKTHAPELMRIDMEGSGSLDGSSEDAFGPLAAMLIGYQKAEFEAFRKCMIDMDADMVKLICCSGSQLQNQIGKALEATPPSIEEPRLGTRRAIILSGMIAEEVSEVIGAYRDAGLPETVWAAAVPANYDRRICDVIEDIYGDHMFLTRNPNAVPQ